MTTPQPELLHPLLAPAALYRFSEPGRETPGQSKMTIKTPILSLLWALFPKVLCIQLAATSTHPDSLIAL